jgi:hypothetical protein
MFRVNSYKANVPTELVDMFIFYLHTKSEVHSSCSPLAIIKLIFLLIYVDKEQRSSQPCALFMPGS